MLANVMMDEDEWVFRLAEMVKDLSDTECAELMRLLGGSLPATH